MVKCSFISLRQISRLFWARSSLIFTQLQSVDSLYNAYVTWQEHTVFLWFLLYFSVRLPLSWPQNHTPPGKAKGKGIWLQFQQLPIKSGRRDTIFGFCNLAKTFKHNTIHLVIKTVTIMIHYCYCLVISGKWRLIIWNSKINITSFIFLSKSV